jgi:LPXTG-site transpeptidase (sortase) family protein
MKTIDPLPKDNNSPNNDAANLIRHKINDLYKKEPDAEEESKEAEVAGTHRSKHQKFMHELSTSGKSLADIQTEWHKYYISLPDDEKHQVWQEFYAEHNRIDQKNINHQNVKTNVVSVNTTQRVEHKTRSSKSKNSKSPTEIKRHIINKVNSKPTHKQHLKSLGFGLGLGTFMIVLFLFGFFNERFIAPFVSPSKSVSNTPIIIDPATAAVGPEPKIIIPKINVEIPVVYDQPSIKEEAIQKSLEDGVVHYATTPLPGEIGNGVIFGHSSNNILNKGKYKFAFVLLKELEEGDTFYLNKDGKRYVYRVTGKTVVDPSDVSVLTTSTEKSTMTLITCDPPGTSLRRLLVTGEQISPDPATNVASTANQTSSSDQVAVIPSNAPSLWQRITGIFN